MARRGRRGSQRGARISRTARLAIYTRDDYTCQYCFTRLEEEECTLDHLVPKSKGGTNIQSNLVVCCRPCNHLKDDEEWPIGFMVDPAAAFKAMWPTKA